MCIRDRDKKGRPAFQTNVAGVYAAGDAKRGPATVVEGIADAAAFAEAVIGAAHTYACLLYTSRCV